MLLTHYFIRVYADPNLTLTKGGLNVSCVLETSVLYCLNLRKWCNGDGDGHKCWFCQSSQNYSSLTHCYLVHFLITKQYKQRIVSCCFHTAFFIKVWVIFNIIPEFYNQRFLFMTQWTQFTGIPISFINACFN